MRNCTFRHPQDLSKRAVEVLRACHENGDDLVAANGLIVWYGYERTNWRVLNQLLECTFVSQDQYMRTHYEINESGARFLQGLPPYRDENGNYHEDANEILRASLAEVSR